MIKYIFDRVVAFFGLLFLLPILLVVSVLIVIIDRHSPLFIQMRTGRYGKPFRIFKLRTMEYDETQVGVTLTLNSDSRVTPLGRFLRKYKLDEFPQLINILIGDMSFVGPRPLVEGFANKLTGENRKILELRPGITSLASIKYANEAKILATVENPEKYNEEVIYPDKVKMELEYYYNHTFLEDLRLIWWTFLPPPYPPLCRLSGCGIYQKKRVKTNGYACSNIAQKLVEINGKEQTYKFRKQAEVANKFIVNCLRIYGGAYA